MDPTIQINIYQAKGDERMGMVKAGTLAVGEEFFAVVMTDVEAQQRRNFEFSVPKGEHFQSGLKEAISKVMAIAAERIEKGSRLVVQKPQIENRMPA